MTLRDRSLVTCSVLAALGKLDELKVQAGSCSRDGVTLDELRGLIMQVTFYAGWPAGLTAGKAACRYLKAKPRELFRV